MTRDELLKIYHLLNSFAGHLEGDDDGLDEMNACDHLANRISEELAKEN